MGKSAHDPVLAQEEEEHVENLVIIKVIYDLPASVLSLFHLNRIGQIPPWIELPKCVFYPDLTQLFMKVTDLIQWLKGTELFKDRCKINRSY